MKKAIIAVVVVTAAFVAIFLSWRGSNQSSTHHASLKVLMEPHGIHGGDATKLRQSRVEEALPILTAILNESGLVAVTDASTSFNTAAFGTNTGDRILKYKGETTGKDNTIPLEALIVIDSKEFEKISITLSEGYSSEPSERLSGLYAKLDQALDQIEGHKYLSKLW